MPTSRNISTQRSTTVPDYIVAGLTDPVRKRTAELKGEVKGIVLQGLQRGVMEREAFFQNIPNIRHGAGVYEARHDMSIWELQGNKIVRRKESEMEAEAVLSALKASEDIEEEQ